MFIIVYIGLAKNLFQFFHKMISFMKNCLFFLIFYIYHKNVNGDYLWMMRFQVRFAFSLYFWFFFFHGGQIMSSGLISHSLYLNSVFCWFYSVSFQVITNIARKNRIYYYLRSPVQEHPVCSSNKKFILWLVLLCITIYSETTTVARANVDWPVWGYIPKYPELTVEKSSLKPHVLLSRIWGKLQGVITRISILKWGGGEGGSNTALNNSVKYYEWGK